MRTSLRRTDPTESQAVAAVNAAVEVASGASVAVEVVVMLVTLFPDSRRVQASSRESKVVAAAKENWFFHQEAAKSSHLEAAQAVRVVLA